MVSLISSYRDMFITGYHDMSYKIAMVAQKGGVGKSTLARIIA